MITKEKPRGTYLGGYDASAIAGVNPYQTPLSTYQRLIGQSIIEQEQSLPMEIGLFMEPFVLGKAEAILSKENGIPITITNQQAFVACEEHPFICGHIDGMFKDVFGNLVLVDAKTTSAWKKHEYSIESGDVPAQALYQIYHYFACLPDVKYAYVVALIGNEAIVPVRVERDELLVQSLVQMEADFWVNHVEKQVPPPASMVSAKDKDLLSGMYSVEPESFADFSDDDEIVGYAKELLEIKARIKELEIAADTYQARLEYSLATSESGKAGKYQFSWKEQSRSTVSTKALKEKYPEIYAELTAVSSSRVFRIKETKEK